MNRSTRPTLLPASRIEPLESRIAPAFSASLAVGVVTFASNDIDGSVVISSNAQGLLTHNLAGPYEGPTDLDPASGVQSIALTAITKLDIVTSTVGNHDVTLGDAAESWSFGVTNTGIRMVTSQGGGTAGKSTLTINNVAETTDREILFAAGEISDLAAGAGGGAGKVSFQDIHFINYIGGSGDDDIEVDAAPVEIKIDPGLGDDNLNIEFGSITQKVSLFDSGGTEDEFEIEGGNGAQNIVIDEPGVTSGQELISFSAASGIDKLTIDGGPDADTFLFLKLTVAGTRVLGGTGADLFQIKNQTTATIDGGEDADSYHIKFNQVEGTAKLTILDTGVNGTDFIKFTAGLLDDQIEGIKGQISFRTLGATAATSEGYYIKFDGVEGESISGGGGGDRFIIKGTSGDLRLDGGTGEDDYFIKFDGSEQHITIAPSPTAIGALETDTLTVLGTNAADSILISPDALTQGRTYIKFDTVTGEAVQSVTVDLGLGNDRVTVDSHDAAQPTIAHKLTVLGGLGNDSVTVRSAAGEFSVDGGAGSDTTSVELARLNASGKLTDSGKFGTDRLFVLGTADDESFIADGSSPDGILLNLEQSSASLQFIKFEGVTIDMGAGDDFIALQKIRELPGKGRVLGGLGNDGFTLSGDHKVGSLILDGGDGDDAYTVEVGEFKGGIAISDSGSSDDGGLDGGDLFTIIGSDNADKFSVGGGLASIGTSRVSFGGLDYIKIDALGGDDLITIKGTSNDCDDLEILAGAGNDRVTNYLKLAPSANDPAAALLLPAVQKVAVSSSTPGAGPHIKIFGGADNDVLIGGAGSEFFDGGTGTDTIKAGGGDDWMTGDEGNDLFDGGGGKDTIIESADADFTFIKVQLTGRGTDTVAGVEAFELTGGDSANLFDFSGQKVELRAIGGGGDDTFKGGTASDSFSGGLGNDKFDGGGGVNTVWEEADVNFTIIGDNKTASLTGLGDDTLANIALITLVGGESNNLLDGMKWSGDLILAGRAGADTLLGGTGRTTFIGGEDDDLITGQASLQNLLVEIGDVDFTLSDSALSGLGTDTLSGITAAILIGGESDNVISAGEFKGLLTIAGLAGDDELLGGTGKTILDGGGGDDLLTGGAKNTKFIGGPGTNTVIKT